MNWYYFGARYYDPEIGRFLSVDRFAEIYPSLSSYQYARNNPLLFIDVNGDSTRETTDPKARAKGIQFEETESIVSIAARPTANERISLSSLGIGTSGSWFNRNFPLATQNDNQFYQFWRGTGNFQQNLKSFTIGVPALSFATVATAAGGIYTYVMYGGQIVGVISTGAGAGISTLQRGYVWATSYGYVYGNKILNSAWNQIQYTANRSVAIGLSNADQINRFSSGFLSAMGSTGSPIRGKSGFTGWSLGRALRSYFKF